MLLQNIKKGIYRFDLFYSEQLLRYNSDTQYKTLTGGILSLIIITAILVGFASMISDTFNKTSITSSLTVTKQSDPPLVSIKSGSDNMFMFSLQIQSTDGTYTANLSQIPKIFSVSAGSIQMKNKNLNSMSWINLQECTQQHWSMMPQFKGRFQQFSASNWLCFPLNYLFLMQGVPSSQIINFEAIQILKCNNYTNNNMCAPQSDIDNIFNTYGNFYLNFNYINSVINPNQPNFISYYIQSKDYVIFSQNMGAEAWIYFSDYQVTTDSSILPYADQTTVKGVIAQNHIINNPFGISNPYLPLARVYLARSTNTLIYRRQVQKISAVLSYIGGLVGAVTAFLFLMKTYTESNLQITLAFKLFQEQKKSQIDAQAVQKKNFNIFSYITLTIYRILKKIGWKGTWKYQKLLQKYQGEALRQLDVELIIKRLIKIQSCLSNLMDSSELQKIKNSNEITVQLAKKMRQLLIRSQIQKQSDRQQIGKIGDIKKQMKIQVISMGQNLQQTGQILQSGMMMNKRNLLQGEMIKDGEIIIESCVDKNEMNEDDNKMQYKFNEIRQKISDLIIKSREKDINI